MEASSSGSVRPRCAAGRRGGVPDWAMLSRIPAIVMNTTRLEPPELISGSGTPVRGRNPSTAPRLTTAWPATRQVIPVARYLPNGYRQRMAMRNQSPEKTAKASAVARFPIRTNSLPMT